MTDVAEHRQAHDPPDRRTESVRVGFLAQENLPVPPPALGGSVSRVVYHLAHELATLESRRFDVTVCSRDHPEVGEGVRDRVRYLRVGLGRDRERDAMYQHVARVLRRLDLPHRELQGMPFYARSYGSAGLQRLAELDPHIVHLQNVSHFVPLARRLAPRAKIVLHMHADWLVQLPRGTVRRRLRDVNLVLGVSDFITDRIREAFPELSDRCRTVHNGADPEISLPRDLLPPELRQLTEELQRHFEIGPGPVVLYVGGFAMEKGTTYLLRAFERVLGEIPDARLVLIGEYGRYFQVRSPRSRKKRTELRRVTKGYRAEVEGLVKRIGEPVIVPGRVPHGELPAYCALADVYVMPSSNPEPFSLTVPEAMACGLPVVGTDAGGTGEIIEHGVNGLLVPPRDEASLAWGLLELCDDRRLAAAMGASARARVLDRFTWRSQALRLAAHYDQLVVVQPCPS
jgi:glycosyltransferase involved in cell wall biosynthesis